MSDHCESCGVPWNDHLGVQGTCQRANRLEEALRGLVETAGSAHECSGRTCDHCRESVRGAIETARKAMEE